MAGFKNPSGIAVLSGAVSTPGGGSGVTIIANNGAQIGGDVNLVASSNTAAVFTNSLALGTWFITMQVDLLTPAVAAAEYDLFIGNNTGVCSFVGPASATFIDEVATAARVMLILSTIITVTTAGTFIGYVKNGGASAATAKALNSTGVSSTGYVAVRLA